MFFFFAFTYLIRFCCNRFYFVLFYIFIWFFFILASFYIYLFIFNYVPFILHYSNFILLTCHYLIYLWTLHFFFIFWLFNLFFTFFISFENCISESIFFFILLHERNSIQKHCSSSFKATMMLICIGNYWNKNKK